MHKCCYSKVSENDRILRLHESVYLKLGKLVTFNEDQ